MLFVAGLYSLGLAVFHLAFWRLFAWREAIAQLSRVNGAILQVLNLCITVIFLGSAVLVWRHGEALTASALGRELLAFIAFFWLLRALMQPLFFSMRPRASRIITVVFVVGAALHAGPLFMA